MVLLCWPSLSGDLGRVPARIEGMKAAVSVLAALVLGLAACGGSEDSTGGGRAGASGEDGGLNWLREVTRGGRTRLAPPLIALNCPVGNGFHCDRVIFHFWMQLPAERLQAWVAGRPVRALRTAPFGGEGPQHGETGLVWTGFVQPAGLTEPGGPIEIHAERRNYWAGRPPVRAPVRVVAELKRGEAVSEVFPAVNLLAGYG
jgi:hypothetical protein